MAARSTGSTPPSRRPRVSYDGTGRAVELGSHAYHADTYSIEMTVVER